MVAVVRRLSFYTAVETERDLGGSASLIWQFIWEGGSEVQPLVYSLEEAQRRTPITKNGKFNVH